MNYKEKCNKFPGFSLSQTMSYLSNHGEIISSCMSLSLSQVSEHIYNLMNVLSRHGPSSI